MPIWKKEEFEPIIEKALKLSKADHTTILAFGFEEGATRFANSEINQNVVSGDLSLKVNVAFGSSVGSASTNVLDDDAIAACVKKAQAIARLTPPDSEFMPPVSPVEMPDVETWSDATMHLKAADRAKIIAGAVNVADSAGLSGAGSLTTAASVVAIGNSKGHFAFHKSTKAQLKYSASSDDSVGWANGYARKVGDLDAEAVARRAVDKALKGKKPRELPAGKYEVILEPAAVAGLISSFMWVQMDAKATDEGRTYLSDKRDKKIAASNVHILSDPTLPDCQVRPFDREGMKLGRVDWIRDGKLANLCYSRFWADHKGKAFTGRPNALIIKGGKSTLEEMIKATQKGLLITRFWYIRTVDRMRDLYTGTTRDGTFLVEDGEVVGPVKNLRFNESAARLLGNVELLGEEQNTAAWSLSRAPFLKASSFNFTSTTEF